MTLHKYVVDTNFFLQCHPPEMIDWSLIGASDDILLLVPRPVQKEIDRFKQKGSDRRSKRARLATKLFRKAIDDDNFECKVRDKNPRVVVRLLKGELNREKLPSSLDLDTSDDLIIAYLIVLRESGDPVKLITDDTNMMVTARDLGIPFVDVPDKWRLDPEPNKQEKEIDKLNKQIQALKSSNPVLGFDFTQESGVKAKELNIVITRFSDIDKVINDGVENLSRSIPPKSDFRQTAPKSNTIGSLMNSVLDSMVWEAPTEEQIRIYLEDQYPSWLENVRAKLENILKDEMKKTRRGVCTVLLSNTGNRPAEHVVVEFEAKGGLRLNQINNEEESEDDLVSMSDYIPTLPHPPKAPKGEWNIDKSLNQSIQNFASNLNPGYLPGVRGNYLQNFSPLPPKKRNRYGFYWAPSRPEGETENWRFECDEFKHQLDSEFFELGVVVPDEVESGRKSIHARVSASNLATPATEVLPVSIKTVERSCKVFVDIVIRKSIKDFTQANLGSNSTGKT